MRLFTIFFILSFIFIWNCSDPEKGNAEKNQAAKTNPGGLTDFEVKYGIGPIKKRMFLGKVNKALANDGEKIFKTKCTACHKLDERYIAPPQRYTAVRRSPEYIMNMILNPDEMVKRHPEGKKLLAEYLSPMTFQNVTEQDARNLLEYLRLVAEEGKEKNIPEVPVYKTKK